MGRRRRPRARRADRTRAEGCQSSRGEGGRAERRRRAQRAARRARTRPLRDLLRLAGGALVVAVLLKSFAVEAFAIPSASMSDTILVGDRVLVDKVTSLRGGQLQRGDIVVFDDPGGWVTADPSRTAAGEGGILRSALTGLGLLPRAGERDVIKRVIGVSGDTIECCNADGRLMVNGEPVDEPYVKTGTQPSEIPFEIKVPEGRLFVMGDNRLQSSDSRAHLTQENGTVAEETVVGRAFAVAWPLSRWRLLGK
ncbi:signal peptidase I [Streptomyces vinaceus]|uniref:signal peptidase I n=1 Tax=Streptomyces vinaceus TaxID=1960 RepID=UPI0038193635